MRRIQTSMAFAVPCMLSLLLITMGPAASAKTQSKQELFDEPHKAGPHSAPGDAPENPEGDDSEAGDVSGEEPGQKRVEPNLSFDPSRVQRQKQDLELDDDAPVPTTKAVQVTANVKALMAAAQALTKQRQYAQVVKLLKPQIVSIPREGLLLLAAAYSYLRDSTNEIQILDLCKTRDPKDYYAVTQLGLAYSKIRKSEDAVANFYDAREANPKYRPAYEALLTELQRQGETYEARTLVQDMITKFGEDPRYYTTLCRLFTKDGFLEKAVETCESARSRDPKVPENFINLALSLKDKLELDRAVKITMEAAGRFPASDTVFATEGSLLAEKKDFAGSLAAYRKATQLSAKSVESWIGLGRASFELHRYKESIEAFQRACKLDIHATKDFREMAGRLHKEENQEWQYKFTDAVSNCMP